MAAHSTNVIRLRLYFDYPPPAVTAHRMCWVLVDLNTCRVVADLESIIREKFELSRRSILNLFIEDCYLPHTESIYVVRDNDNVRVEVDCLPQVNGHSETTSENCRKRQRAIEEEEDGQRQNGVNVEWTKKKRKKRTEEETGTPKQKSGEDKNKKSPEKQAEKKKKKKKAEENPTVTPKEAASNKKNTPSVNLPAKSTKKPQVVQTKTKKVSSSDSSSSSSSEEDEAPKKTATKTPTPTPAASKINNKPPPQRKAPSSSSSSSDSSSDEATNVKIQPKNTSLISKAPSVQQSVNCAQKQVVSEVEPPQEKVSEPHESDSEEEIQLVIKRPLPQPSLAVGGQSAWCGRGRGRPWNRGGGGQRGRGAGRGHGGSMESRFNGDKEPSYHTDSLTNKSVILQNGTLSPPKQDYSSMPLLAAPPQVGQKIAFKLLELTENYTPEVSEYKEGKIVSFDPTSRQIELELLNVSHTPVAPGKFDLVYQNPDGSERVEYTVSRESCVSERWESLLEPRLII